jgi:hypothetical protein
MLKTWHNATRAAERSDMSDVKVLACWDGWCSPCGDDRPLTLLETGRRGLRSWLHGIGSEDRELTLTCRVCGQWQSVPQHEEDDPAAPISVPLILSTAVAGRSVTIAYGPPPAQLPAPRTSPWPILVGADTDPAMLELLADGLDVVSSKAS